MAKTGVLLGTVFLIQLCSQLVRSGAGGSAVKFLPGFDGPLPFQLESGYIGVGDSEDVQLFYYFIKSESNPKSDPLLLWLTGGPGCSALSGLIYEIGPIKFASLEYNGSLPTLLSNPYSWTKWLVDHQDFVSNSFYIAGDSYAAQLIPIITQIISNENEKGINTQINVKGYILGNAATFPSEYNYRYLFAHGMGFISDELFESLTKNCKGELYGSINQKNVKCYKNFETFNQLTSKINYPHILELSCEDVTHSQKWFAERRFLNEKSKDAIRSDPLFSTKCRGSIGEWKRCNNDLDYIYTKDDVIPYHLNLSFKGYRSLVYSGDHDFIIPYISTQTWIRSLNFSIIDEWRTWMVEGQVAGYTRTYSNNMTFATVKGGGHTAPEYKPNECLTMIRRWLSYNSM